MVLIVLMQIMMAIAPIIFSFMLTGSNNLKSHMIIGNEDHDNVDNSNDNNL